VVVHGDSGLLPLLDSVVDGRALQLRGSWHPSVRTDSRTWVEVTAPKFARCPAPARAISIDTMKVPVSLSIPSGSGCVQGAKHRRTVAALESGSAGLDGRSARLDIDLSGSGGIDTADLRADDVRVSIAGAGASVRRAWQSTSPVPAT
jgi:hypothetical protein